MWTTNLMSLHHNHDVNTFSWTCLLISEWLRHNLKIMKGFDYCVHCLLASCLTSWCGLWWPQTEDTPNLIISRPHSPLVRFVWAKPFYLHLVFSMILKFVQHCQAFLSTGVKWRKMTSLTFTLCEEFFYAK